MSQALEVAAAAAAGSGADVGAVAGVVQDVAPLLPLWAEVAVAVLVLSGALFALLGSLGLMRLPTYFERVHAPSIIATMGCWLILWAAVIFFSAVGHELALHMMLVAVFIAVTVPITTIFLMRAALFRARRSGQADVPMSLSRRAALSAARGPGGVVAADAATAPPVPGRAVAAAVAVVSSAPGSRSARNARRKQRRR